MQSIQLCALALSFCACVTPQGMKDVSQKHTTNMASLKTGVEKFRKALATYYAAQESRQRDAFISQMTARDFDQIVKTQLDSLDTKPALPDRAAPDFIDAGVRLADQRGFWGRHFDFWVDELKGDSLEAKRSALTERIGALTSEMQSAHDPRQTALLKAALGALQRSAHESDDDLTYPSVALDLRRQQKNLDGQLEVLSKQIEAMQAFHGIIDQYLAIDATIDGGKIAEAAKAGASFDPTLFKDAMNLVGGKP